MKVRYEVEYESLDGSFFWKITVEEAYPTHNIFEDGQWGRLEDGWQMKSRYDNQLRGCSDSASQAIGDVASSIHAIHEELHEWDRLLKEVIL